MRHETGYADMTLLREKIARARKKAKAILRKKFPAKLSDNAIAAAEDRMWHDSMREQANTTLKHIEDLPDGETVELHLTRVADKAVVGEAVILTMATALMERDGIAQRVRARSRGRQEVGPAPVPPTTAEAGTAVKGQWLADNSVLLVLVVMVVLVVYVVERIGTIIKQ